LQELRQKHEETIVKTELALILKSIREDNVYFIQDKLKTDLPLLERWYLQLKSEMVYKKPREIVQPKLNIKKVDITILDKKEFIEYIINDIIDRSLKLARTIFVPNITIPDEICYDLQFEATSSKYSLKFMTRKNGYCVQIIVHYNTQSNKLEFNADLFLKSMQVEGPKYVLEKKHPFEFIKEVIWKEIETSSLKG